MKTFLTLIIMLFLGCRLQAQVSFILSSTVKVGDEPNLPAAVDINGDGKVDLICANFGDNTLSVLTNDGSGNFRLTGTYAVGLEPVAVVAADVNGDGKVDLICCNYGDNTISVLTNNGSGGFALSGTYAVGGQPVWVTAADVSGHGKVDLISANYYDGTLSVLTNNGSGGFALSVTYAVGGFAGAACVTTADVNGHGKLDLISCGNGNANSNALSVLTNNGSGGFALAYSLGLSGAHTSVVATDVNGDGKVDLILANDNDNSLSVLTNNGSGGFALSGTYPVGTRPYVYLIAAADVNGDGNVDLISANQGDNTLSVLTNNGSGGFGAAGTFAVGNSPYFVTAADVNGDGKVDLISANEGDNTLSILTNATPFPTPATGPILVCPDDAIAECTGHPIALTAQVASRNGDALTVIWAVNGMNVQTNSVPPTDNTNFVAVVLMANLELGTNIVIVTVTNSAGSQTSCDSTTIVQDSIPPVITKATACPAKLWPPNDKMIPIRISVVAHDNCCLDKWKIISVTSNEPVDCDKTKSKNTDKGDRCADTPSDWIITGDHGLSLRAGRAGTRTARVYTITVQAQDCAGNLSAPATLTVTVSHDQGEGNCKK